MLAFIFSLLVGASAAQSSMGKTTLIKMFIIPKILTYPHSELCQMPGNAICKSVDLPGYAFHPCCPGSVCLPWTGKGYVAGADPDYFCQFSQPIAVGGDCRVRSSALINSLDK